MNEDLRMELDWVHGRINCLEAELAESHRNMRALEEYSESVIASLSHEIRTLRLENERLLKLIQEQDKLIRANDTATEIKLADKLAEALQKADLGRWALGGEHIHQALNEWKTARGVDFEDKTMDSGKRVS